MRKVDDVVVAKIDLLNDLRDDGLGIQVCARKGDELVIRELRTNYLSGKVSYAVSHEHITDSSFIVDEDEVEDVKTH